MDLLEREVDLIQQDPFHLPFSQGKYPSNIPTYFKRSSLGEI
jgi:hypothetical protein